MDKRLAMKYAAAILSLEDLQAIVDEQVGGANEALSWISVRDRKRICEAAELITQRLFRRAGKVVDAVAPSPTRKRKPPKGRAT